MVGRVQCHPHEIWCHIMVATTKVSINSIRSLRRRMAPQGWLDLRQEGLTCILTTLLTSHWMLAIPRKVQDFGKDSFLQLTRIPKGQHS